MIYAQDIIDALKAELSTARAENEALRKRIAELEERIAELYRAEKNSFLSLKGTGDTLAQAIAHAEQAEAQLAEAKSALSAEREDFESLATIHAENKARIASLEKSVTVLREALRVIDNQNTRYGRPGPAARIARAAVAQATDQPTTAEP